MGGGVCVAGGGVAVFKAAGACGGGEAVVAAVVFADEGGFDPPLIGADAGVVAARGCATTADTTAGTCVVADGVSAACGMVGAVNGIGVEAVAAVDRAPPHTPSTRRTRGTPITNDSPTEAMNAAIRLIWEGPEGKNGVAGTAAAASMGAPATRVLAERPETVACGARSA